MSDSVLTQRRSTAPPPRALRDRARRAVRAEVETVAFALFAEHGFEGTTIEQIYTNAGISRSTFFRYFPTKEDLVVGGVAECGLEILIALEERPENEPPWRALRHAVEPVIEASVNDPDTTRLTTRMLQETPALAARRFEKQLQWQELLVPEIARRLGIVADDRIDPRPHALVAGMLACLDAAIRAWSELDDEVDLSTLLGQAMGALRD